MTRLMLNDSELPIAIVPACWGDLLTGLEQSANQRGEVVTAVRFDGVDEPTFGQPAQFDRSLDAVQLIELETATPGDLLDEALAQGALASEALGAAASQIGTAFRGADIAGPNLRMAEFGDGIRSIVWILNTAAAVRSISLDRMDSNGRPISAQLTELTGHLIALVEAQQAEDWLTVADILEYDFTPSLQAFRQVFEGLRSAIPTHS
jgi:hypothetical protein